MTNYVDWGMIASNGVSGSPRVCSHGSGIQGDFVLSNFKYGVISSAFMVGLLVASPIYASLAKRPWRLVGYLHQLFQYHMILLKGKLIHNLQTLALTPPLMQFLMKSKRLDYGEVGLFAPFLFVRLTLRKSEKPFETESAYAHSEDESAKSPAGSPTAQKIFESPTKEDSFNHFGKSFDADTERGFDDQRWGTFDNNDDVDSVWGFNSDTAKDAEHEKHGVISSTPVASLQV